MRRKFLVYAVLLAMLASVSCARSANKTPPPSAGPAIFGGFLVKQDSSLRRGIVAISYAENGGTRVCTGILIGPQTVVTAAHCIGDGVRTMRVYFFMTQISLYGFQNSDPKYDRTVTNAWPAPGFMEIHQQDPSAANPYDMAVLRLDHPAPPQAAAFELNSNPNVLSPGQRAYVAGYGYQAYYPASQRSVGNMFFRYTTQELLPQQAGLALLRLDGTEGAGTCKGDSGGPVYLEGARSGTYLLIGVLAGTMFPEGSVETCHHTTTAVDVAPLSRWISKLIL